MNMNIKTARQVETQINLEIERLFNKVSGLANNTSNTSESMLSNINASALDELLPKIDQLIDIKYSIRDAISSFNSDKIDDLCLQIAKESKKLQLMNQLCELPTITQRFNLTKNMPVYYGAFTEDVQEGYLIEARKMQRSITRLKDQCTGINAQGNIELSNEQISVLKKYGFLD